MARERWHDVLLGKPAIKLGDEQTDARSGGRGSRFDLELKMGDDRGVARPLRIDIQNGPHHVTSRGWERRVMVHHDADCQHWLERLDRVAVRCGWRVFARVLMTNRFHLYLGLCENPVWLDCLAVLGQIRMNPLGPAEITSGEVGTPAISKAAAARRNPAQPGSSLGAAVEKADGGEPKQLL